MSPRLFSSRLWYSWSGTRRCNRVQPIGNETGYCVFETLRQRDLLYRKVGIASIPAGISVVTFRKCRGWSRVRAAPYLHLLWAVFVHRCLFDCMACRIRIIATRRRADCGSSCHSLIDESANFHHRCHRILLFSRGIETPWQRGISRAV